MLTIEQFDSCVLKSDFSVVHFVLSITCLYVVSCDLRCGDSFERAAPWPRLLRRLELGSSVHIPQMLVGGEQSTHEEGQRHEGPEQDQTEPPRHRTHHVAHTAVRLEHLFNASN